MSVGPTLVLSDKTDPVSVVGLDNPERRTEYLSTRPMQHTSCGSQCAILLRSDALSIRQLVLHSAYRNLFIQSCSYM